MNRLPYETSAGSLSAEDTYAQLLENLRLAEEDGRLLASHCAARNDPAGSAAWTSFADNFHRVGVVIVILARHRANPSSLGYSSNYKIKQETDASR